MHEQTIAFLIWFQDYRNEDGDDLHDVAPERFKQMYDLWVKEWLPALHQPHNGDCVKLPAPCTRCHVERTMWTAKLIASAINHPSR